MFAASYAPPEARRDPLVSAINGTTGVLLTHAIHHSRDAALKDGARPLPAHMRRDLAGHFDPALLARARWTIAGDRFAIDSVLAWWLPEYRAVTLDDVIVFFDRESVGEKSIWIHELHHVEQFHRVGVNRFSREYVTNWQSIELATRLETRSLLRSFGIRLKRPAQSRPEPLRSGSVGEGGGEAPLHQSWRKL